MAGINDGEIGTEWHRYTVVHTGKYRYFDFYEPYFDREADVDGYVAPV